MLAIETFSRERKKSKNDDHDIFTTYSQEKRKYFILIILSLQLVFQYSMSISRAQLSSTHHALPKEPKFVLNFQIVSLFLNWCDCNDLNNFDDVRFVTLENGPNSFLLI